MTYEAGLRSGMEKSAILDKLERSQMFEQVRGSNLPGAGKNLFNQLRARAIYERHAALFPNFDDGSRFSRDPNQAYEAAKKLLGKGKTREAMHAVAWGMKGRLTHPGPMVVSSSPDHKAPFGRAIFNQGAAVAPIVASVALAAGLAYGMHRGLKKRTGGQFHGKYDKEDEEERRNRRG